MIALGQQLNQPLRGESIMDSRGITFAIGHTVQDFVTQRLKDNYGHELWGNWSCRCGEEMRGHITWKEVEDEPSCGQCGQPIHNYIETVWRSEELKLTGSIDAVLKRGPRYAPLEIKSIAGGRFDELTRPIPDHLIQALFYWYLLRENGMDMHDHFSILYVKKEFVFGNPYKEFVICASDYENRMTDFLDEARELKAFRFDDGPLPVRSCCANENSPAARECPFAIQCFAIDPPLERGET
jgi:hypothetical protein